jgi:hypothetical protein
MYFYLLLLESFFYGIGQSLLDNYQDFLTELPNNSLPIKFTVVSYSLLFFIFILRLSRILDNFVETIIFLIFIADTDSILKNIALGSAIIFNVNSLVYYITASYIAGYAIKLHDRVYIEAFITKLGEVLDKNYRYINVPNYLLYYICNDQKY